jgi:hypothetical protein
VSTTSELEQPPTARRADADYNKRWHDAVWSVLFAVCRRSRFVARTLEIGGHVSSYALWQHARGLGTAPRYANREAMWRDVFPRLATGVVTVLEFGTAHGAATRAWLGSIDNPQLRWHGFDVFSGLPQPWSRGGIEFTPQGAFDAGGRPPAIDDPRVTWHVGLVEETLPRLDLPDPGQLCMLFDLDLYEPSAFALDYLGAVLKPGALLYFDEAYDPWHERRLLDEFLDSGHRVRVLGTTGIALLLEYVGGP